jgi:hypothetical protein
VISAGIGRFRHDGPEMCGRRLRRRDHAAPGRPTVSTTSSRRRVIGLPDSSRQPHGRVIFVVTESDATAIRTAYEQEGKLSVAIEFRQLFSGITDNMQARECAGPSLDGNRSSRRSRSL